MSENTQSQSASTETSETKYATFVDALFDIGTAWAESGLSYGKSALEHGAEALTRSAKALETIQKRIHREAKNKVS